MNAADVKADNCLCCMTQLQPGVDSGSIFSQSIESADFEKIIENEFILF